MTRYFVAALAALSAGTLLAPVAALADEIVVKGMRLEGTVVGVTAEGVQVDSAYGTGTISIPWADLDRVETEGRFVVLHGEEGISEGRLLGVQNGELLLGGDRVPADTIFKGFTEADYADSTWRRLKAQYRHWRGLFTLNGALTQATTDTATFAMHAEIERRKSPTRVIATLDYLTGEQKDGDGQNRLDNELRGLLRGEYELTERLFSFASFAGSYDQIERLNFRGVAKAGLGYRVWQSERGELNADIGGSYVYEDYFPNRLVNPAPPPPTTPDPRPSSQDYWAVAFGADGHLDLAYGATLRGRAEYIPSIIAWTENYLVRGSLVLELPLLEWLSLNFALYDEYNNAPAEGAFKNKLSVIGGLGATF